MSVSKPVILKKVLELFAEPGINEQVNPPIVGSPISPTGPPAQIFDEWDRDPLKKHKLDGFLTLTKSKFKIKIKISEESELFNDVVGFIFRKLNSDESSLESTGPKNEKPFTTFLTDYDADIFGEWENDSGEVQLTIRLEMKPLGAVVSWSFDEDNEVIGVLWGKDNIETPTKSSRKILADIGTFIAEKNEVAGPVDYDLEAKFRFENGEKISTMIRIAPAVKADCPKNSYALIHFDHKMDEARAAIFRCVDHSDDDQSDHQHADHKKPETFPLTKIAE